MSMNCINENLHYVFLLNKFVSCQSDRCNNLLPNLCDYYCQCIDSGGKGTWEYCCNIAPSFHLNRYSGVGENLLLLAFYVT